MNAIKELEFLASFLPFQERRLTRTGVEIHLLQYWSDALTQWVGKGRKVRVHYDPRDITFTYVCTPSGLLVKSPVTTPKIQPISLAEWQARCRYEKSLSSSPERIAERDKSLRRAEAIVEQAKGSRRLRRRLATQAAGDPFRATSTGTRHDSDKAIVAETTEVVSEFAPVPYAIEEDGYESFY